MMRPCSDGAAVVVIPSSEYGGAVQVELEWLEAVVAALQQILAASRPAMVDLLILCRTNSTIFASQESARVLLASSYQMVERDGTHLHLADRSVVRVVLEAVLLPPGGFSPAVNPAMLRLLEQARVPRAMALREAS